MVELYDQKDHHRRRQRNILILFLILAISACLGLSRLLADTSAWDWSGPLLLFVCLLTLLNAPFAWLSLGLTRALLRRGLELKGWWPYILALVDALAAGVIVALLTITIVIGVQAFDDLAIRGGAAPVLPLSALLSGITLHPGSPEFWWVYALLLSTVIPSLVNLMIGGTALLRAIPGVGSFLLRYLPSNRPPPTYNRAWIALVLTLQSAGGIVLGIAAQVALAVVLISYAMPALGIRLLDVARAVTEFDLPMRMLSAFD